MKVQASRSKNACSYYVTKEFRNLEAGRPTTKVVERLATKRRYAPGYPGSSSRPTPTAHSRLSTNSARKARERQMGERPCRSNQQQLKWKLPTPKDWGSMKQIDAITLNELEEMAEKMYGELKDPEIQKLIRDIIAGIVHE